MEQAALSNGLLLDLAAFLENGRGAAEVDVGRREAAEVLVGSAVVAMLDEGGDGVLEAPGRKQFSSRMRFLSVWCQRSILPWVCGWFGAPRTWPMPWSCSQSARSPET
jgi:hypothetical protein